MPTETKLDFSIPMINNHNGKPLLKPTKEELEKHGITQFITTGISQVDQQNQYQYEEALSANAEYLSKYTLDAALNQLFDVTEMPNNSDFALYNQILIDIRNAKQKQQSSITISKEELTKFKKIFEKPPKNPQLNRIVGFILECLEQSYVNILIPTET